MRAAEADGAGALQAVRHEAPRRSEPRAEHQERQAHGRARPAAGLGCPRGGHPRAPGPAQPRTDPAPPGDPGVRAGPGRGQGHQDPPARLRGVQRRLRRRPDGGARPVVRGGAGRSPDPHAVDQQHPVAGARTPHRDPVAGHGPRALLPDAHPERRDEGRGHPDVRLDRRGTARVRPGSLAPRSRARPAHGQGAAGGAPAGGVRPQGGRMGQADAGDPLDHRPDRVQHRVPRRLRVPERARLEAGRGSPGRRGRAPVRPDPDRDRPRQPQEPRVPLRHQGGRDDRRRGRHHASGEAEDPGRAREACAEGRAAVPQGHHHGRRTPPGAHRDLDAGDRRGQGRDGGPVHEDQPDLHDGQLGRAREHHADPAAGGDARPRGQPEGGDHPPSDQVELPRGSVGPRVLHLDPRCAQGSGRHRAADGRLGLPHKASRRRGTRGHRPRGGLRHGSVDHGRA